MQPFPGPSDALQLLASILPTQQPQCTDSPDKSLRADAHWLALGHTYWSMPESITVFRMLGKLVVRNWITWPPSKKAGEKQSLRKHISWK